FPLNESTCAVGPTFFRSAARGLHGPAARRKASRKTRRGSAGPANGRASAAAASWAARLLRLRSLYGRNVDDAAVRKNLSHSAHPRLPILYDRARVLQGVNAP